MRIHCKSALIAATALTTAGMVFLSGAEDWRPAESPILTRWARQVTPENVWQEYPRPQMVRPGWQNLNGLWDYAVAGTKAPRPESFEGRILVPFPIEAPLSGVGRQMKPDEVIWYRRSFAVADAGKGRRTLLHFEAADWETTAWVNGRKVGEHRGGYDPFTFDITEALQPGSEQELLVRVWDPQTSYFKSLGKQFNTANTYERTSGIWQTVWLESVPETSIERLAFVPDIQAGRLLVTVRLRGTTKSCRVKLQALDGDRVVGEATGAPGAKIALPVPSPKLWSPDEPFLYGLKAALVREGETIDVVESYFGMREISLGGAGGGKRILLNGKPIFQMGPLDQNYWPGGALTPPSDEAMRFEVDYLKRIGCNMVRLHIKRNPRRWYYHCDQAGLLVWQDFVSAIKPEKNPPREQSEQWLREQRRMMDALQTHPSIVMWIVFNESWGQHDTGRITRWVKAYDPTRLVSPASGWNDVPGLGDVRDVHDYTLHPSVPVPRSNPLRAVVLGECGGFNSVVAGHNWYGETPKQPVSGEIRGSGGGMRAGLLMDFIWTRDYKRPTYSHGASFGEHYGALVDDLNLLRAHGLSGAVYTQMTDMKIEQNGYLSMDREVSKADPDALHRAHQRLYGPVPRLSPLLPVSLTKPQTWRYALEEPAPGWMAPEYDDSGWKAGPGPFGKLAGQAAGTTWEGERLFLRKRFHVDRLPEKASLVIYFYGESNREVGNARVYLNGKLIHDNQTRQRKPELRVSEILLRPEMVRLLRQGENMLAVAVRVNPGTGARLFDIGLQRVEE